MLYIKKFTVNILNSSAGKLHITCRDRDHQYISWWAGERSTSWCKDTSPPYSLQREKIHDKLNLRQSRGQDEAYKTLCEQFTRPPEGQFRGHLQSAVTHWLARCLQVLGYSLKTKKEITIRFKNTSWRRPIAMTHRQTDVMQHNLSWSKAWLMRRRALPGSGAWATAASAVEQKPHEGSVSQHKNKHTATQP